MMQLMRKFCMWPYLLLGAAILTSSVGAESYRDQVTAGNESFRAGAFSDALDYYRGAEAEIPESPELEYNIATTLHEQGAYEEAVDRFGKALNTMDILQEGRAHYNMGNTYFRMEDYQKAIEHYQRALEIDPEDMDAKYNLELARRKLKEQMEQQEKDPEQEQDQQEKQEQEQQEQEKQEENEDQQEEQQPQEQQDEEQPPEEQPQPQEPDEEELSKEDAERILNALRDDEQDMQKKRKQIKIPSNYLGKDW
jgi:Ca-activated chloride channel family protein